MAAPAIIPMRPVPIEQMFVTCAFTLLFAASSMRFLLQASSLQSGKTPEVNASDFPSGAHKKLSTPLETLVSARGFAALDRNEIDL